MYPLKILINYPCFTRHLPHTIFVPVIVTYEPITAFSLKTYGQHFTEAIILCLSFCMTLMTFTENAFCLITALMFKIKNLSCDVSYVIFWQSLSLLLEYIIFQWLLNTYLTSNRFVTKKQTVVILHYLPIIYVCVYSNNKNKKNNNLNF